MKTIAFHNLGCKVNAYETDVMMQNLQKKGWKIVPFDGKADVYLFPPGGDALVVHDVEIVEGLELDIRERFYAWCDKGEPV